MKSGMQPIRALLIAEECDPEGMAGPLIGWKLYREIATFTAATLVTRARYRKQIEQAGPLGPVIYIEDSTLAQRYRQFLQNRVFPHLHNWSLRRLALYPLYTQFDRSLNRQLRGSVADGKFDIVHSLTPLVPRYPVRLSAACKTIPFVIGPLNGGLPVPDGFAEVQRRDFGGTNILRAVSRLQPHYAATYAHASKILVGSEYTQSMLRSLFSIPDQRLQVMAENGIDQVWQCSEQARSQASKLQLLFVGRLVLFKGVDILLQALSQLSEDARNKIQLTIVGDGPMREDLEQLSHSLKIEEQVRFVGWVQQQETHRHYEAADLFCYPSVRESGGAVVLEAMAHGLPCIVTNHGGISEYVGPSAGVRIPARNPQQMAATLATELAALISNPERRKQLAAHALLRAEEYTWANKKQQLRVLYQELLKTAGIERGILRNYSDTVTI